MSIAIAAWLANASINSKSCLLNNWLFFLLEIFTTPIASPLAIKGTHNKERRLVLVDFKVLIRDIEVDLTENTAPYDGEWTNNDIVATIEVPLDVTTMESVYYRIGEDDTLITTGDTIENGKVIKEKMYYYLY